jgi:O-antigen/teichoic acid export membrane protein
MPAFRAIVVNAGWNLLGNVLPLLAGLVAVPFLVGHLGTERFGLLSLAWILIGYFGLFDFGLGRALTRMVAERWTGQRDAALESLCSTGLALGAAAGAAGGLLVAAAAGFGDGGLGPHAPELAGEARAALVLVGCGVLPTVLAAVLRGVLEGVQRFKTLNAIRVPAGVLLFAAPCLSAAFSPRLDLAVASLVATRWLVLLAHALVCASSVRLSGAAVRSAWVAPLLRFGGWLTVSNVVGPVIVYLDRFVIGALLPPNQLGYYAAPFEMVSRLLVLPTSLSGALFPALSSTPQGCAPQARELRRKAVRLTAALVLPAAFVGVLAARPLLHWWLGEEFALHGSRAMQILLVGFAFNALAQIPMVALHGHGHARATALLHLVELPVYALFLYAMVSTHGLVGAALAWSARGALDLVALSLMLRRVERPAAALPLPARG